MDRLDLFSMVHKGIRAKLFEVAQSIARTDFDDPGQVETTVVGIHELLGLLDEHAAHEDREILPQLASTAPGVCSELHADHVRLEALHHEIRSLVTRLESSSSHERRPLGRRLHGRIGCLVAEHLLHMNREETAGNRALWAHRTDAELLAIRQRMVGAIPAARMARWMELMMTAVSAPERSLLQSASTASPPR